jgi:hypothetical protein
MNEGGRSVSTRTKWGRRGGSYHAPFGACTQSWFDVAIWISRFPFLSLDLRESITLATGAVYLVSAKFTLKSLFLTSDSEVQCVKEIIKLINLIKNQIMII